MSQRLAWPFPGHDAACEWCRLLRRRSGGRAGILLEIVERRLELRVLVGGDQLVLDRRGEVVLAPFLGEVQLVAGAARLLAFRLVDHQNERQNTKQTKERTWIGEGALQLAFAQHEAAFD